MPRRGSRLSFQLHQIEFRNAARRPKIGRQSHFSEGLAVEIEGETLDGAGAEVPAGDDAVGGDATKWFGHRRMLLSK